MEQIKYKIADFEGPLDLLLYLISKHKMNIFDISISDLLDQYLKHIDMLKGNNLEIASDFLEMTARLIHIKTVMLLPKHEEDADKLKQELTGQLIEYNLCKKTAHMLGEIYVGYDLFTREMLSIEQDDEFKGHLDRMVLLDAYMSAAGKKLRKLPPPASVFSNIVTRRIVSVKSRILFIIRKLFEHKRLNLNRLYENSEDRSEMIATFLAVLELARSKDIIIENDEIHKLNTSGDINWNLESSDLI